MALPPTEFSELIADKDPAAIYATLQQQQLLSERGRAMHQDVINFIHSTKSSMSEEFKRKEEAGELAPGPTEFNLFVRAHSYSSLIRMFIPS
jgi:hypothetical protein